ncbi:hypothetical protein DYB34_003772 [Aphanomyces astaci]|uniref:GYF domain-containing protein n=3 Tax=Aphanomyces astaci TaxID=112090 RepID=A0A397AEP9_APHAT|nr:hypothetical protein DYB36_001588 [Aphanomyces astaci]RHY47997.1 hypothetical protein DYB34_003772 [Aphanomyces astaci]
MMAFNLKEDREEGHFDESGNFVWAKEEQPMQEDAWLENVSAQEMEGAERARILRQEARTDDEETWTERRATSVFMEVLEEGETVLKALKRLGKKKKGSKGPEQTADMKREFDELTEATDFLMRQGKADVYHTPKEQLVPQAPPPPPVLWEYKSQDGLIQGPFPSSNFVEWQAQGYFRGDSAVQMRRYEATDVVAKESSAAKDLEDDFDDDDEEKEEDGDGRWVSSDTIDFRRSSCLSWEDESEDDSTTIVLDGDVEIHCERDHYPPQRRQRDAAMFEASVLGLHTCSHRVLLIFNTLRHLHRRIYDDRCLADVRPCFLQLELARAASSVEVMKRTMLDLPSTLLDLLLDMIDDTWQDVVGLHHYNKRGEVHYALL